jgi:hypothetical protein
MSTTLLWILIGLVAFLTLGIILVGSDVINRSIKEKKRRGGYNPHENEERTVEIKRF